MDVIPRMTLRYSNSARYRRQTDWRKRAAREEYNAWLSRAVRTGGLCRMCGEGGWEPTSSSIIHFKDCEEGLLGNFDAANALHSFLAFLLLFQQLAFSSYITAVAFSQDVLA